MSELQRIDQHVSRLKWRLARGGMTYDGAVAIDELITILTAIRSRLANDIETGRPKLFPLSHDLTPSDDDTMMSKLGQVNRLLADMKRHSERSDLTYGESVMIEDIISALEQARARAAEAPKTRFPDTPRPI